MKYAILILMICWGSVTHAQNTRLLETFSNLVGRTWLASGTWSDGSVFKQEITFNSDLENQLITSNSVGFINIEQTEWGARNHGVRQWNENEQKIKFWEFDVFGEVSTGTVSCVDQNIYYNYQYGEGERMMNLTDAWEYVDDQTYNFKVGVFENGTWSSIYLETKFKALPTYSGKRHDLDAILAQTIKFSETYKSGDHIALSKFYTEDGKIMPGGDKIIQGRSDIAARWKLGDGVSILSHEVRPVEINIIGDIAYDYGYYHGSSRGVDGTIYPFNGKYVIVWKKLNGRWFIDIDIWNNVKD